jgi:5-formyltetrahydrofolate cyclo-ligase
MKKEELRNEYKTKRIALAPGALEEMSRAICLNLFTHFQLENKTISVFLPIERQKEVNTYRIVEKGMTINARIAIPKSDFVKGTMKHYLYEEGMSLTMNSLGIPEPVKGKLIRPDQLDFVIVPLLAISEKGQRVGYGKGFYDKFLRKCNPSCQFIGLHLFDEWAEIEDVNRFDIALHHCVTPNKVVHFG